MHPWVPELEELIRSAGAAVLDVYHSAFAVTTKEDRTPLTLADQNSHAILAEGLRRIAPEIPLLSEEGAEIPYETRRHWQRFWLVDPLDGTKEFIKRNGEFTINVALIEEGRPVLGLVLVPDQDRLFIGDGGERLRGKAPGRDEKAPNSTARSRPTLCGRGHPIAPDAGHGSVLSPSAAS